MKPYFWALLSALVWGIAPIIEKLGLSKTPVLPGLVFRCLGVILGLMLLLAFRFNQIKTMLPQASQGGMYLVAGGLLASVVGQLFFYNALRGGEASQVVPIAAAYPLISFTLGIIFLSEKVTLSKLGGMVFVLMGVVLLK